VTADTGVPGEPGEAGDAGNSIKVVQRTFAVLEAVGAENDGVTVAQIQAGTGLPLATVYRLLRTIQALGYAEQDVDSGLWHVGLRVLELRGRPSAATRLATVARPLLKDLMLASGGLAHLALYRQGEVIYVDTVRDLRSLDTYVPPGHRMPAHCVALGKVLLAELSGDQLARFVAEKGLPPRTPDTITTHEALVRELARVRAAGYAAERGEAAPESRSFAAPVRDYTERVIAALSVSGYVQNFPDERHAELIQLVTAAARQLSHRLGYQPGAVFEPLVTAPAAYSAVPVGGASPA
jgi:DNA-binding IclR family transcriptional regulator